MCIPRKHSDVIKAIADGKPVQYQTRPSGLFNDWNDSCRMNPISDPLLEWRIKPEPKPDRVFESETPCIVAVICVFCHPSIQPIVTGKQIGRASCRERV